MDDIEFRLRAFRPRQPAPLLTVLLWHRSRKPFWVAAAVLAAAIVVAVRLNRPVAAPAGDVIEHLTLGELTMLAIERPEELDAALTRLSRTSLPDVTQPGGVLQRLAVIR